MKSPVGDAAHCEEVAQKRVTKAINVISAIAEIPDAHCALHLLRYQAGRLNYLTRTTPASDIDRALEAFDVAVRAGYETIVGKPVPDKAFSQAVLPTRLGGLGLVAARANADAAYCASRAAMRDKGRAIFPGSPGWGDAMSENDPLQAAVSRINAKLSPDEAYVLPTDDDEESLPVRQQSIVQKMAKSTWTNLQENGGRLDKARMQAYAAPGAGRWQGAIPSKTLDKHLTSSQLRIVTAVQLGVDVFDDAHLCVMCGLCADTKGIHSLSCTGGGDIVVRHNDVRDIVHHFASRGGLRPQLEKAGLLHEPGIFLEMRRPADVLVEGLAQGSRGNSSMKFALDIKVINALGAAHLDDTAQGPLVAAEAYREKALVTNQTAERCKAQGIVYEPLVFTCQGGCEKRAEGIISQIADAIASAGDVEAATVKSDFLEQISACLARHTARAISRRIPKKAKLACNALTRYLRDAGDTPEDEEMHEGLVPACGPAPAQDIRLSAATA